MATRKRQAPAQLHSLVQAAAIFGVHRNTMAKWIDQGCPVVTKADRARGIEWELSLPDVINWRMDRAIAETVAKYEAEDGRVSLEEARRRKAVSEAVVAEIEVEEALGRVVDIGYAAEKLAAKLAEVRTRLTPIGAKVAGRAATISSAPKIQELVDQEVREALEPIADGTQLLGDHQPAQER